MPSAAATLTDFTDQGDEGVLRVATYNIHKGVQGIGPVRRLEIHNLALAVDTLDADIVCLQEVRMVNRREADYFSRKRRAAAGFLAPLGGLAGRSQELGALCWPQVPQADFLAPEGYEAVYCTNAVTRHGEHGNALLSRWPIVRHRHEDMSDHRFEQRGLLHVEILVNGVSLHAIVVHFGLIPASRLRQTGAAARPARVEQWMPCGRHAPAALQSAWPNAGALAPAWTPAPARSHLTTGRDLAPKCGPLPQRR